MEFPKEYFENIFKKQGMKVRKDAILELDVAMTEFCEFIAINAVQLVNNSNRIEVTEDDVKQVLYDDESYDDNVGIISRSILDDYIYDNFNLEISDDAFNLLVQEIEFALEGIIIRAGEISKEKSHDIIENEEIKIAIDEIYK